jgi:hypothetical protein
VEGPFIDAWVAGDSEKRAMLTEVASWVDANLAENPDNKGQARPDLAARIVAVPIVSSSARVSVTFRVLADDRQVRVIRLVFRGG